MHPTRSAARRFSFASRWRLEAPAERVRDVVVALDRYPEWWPQVRAVAGHGPDEARVLIRSALPYTLDLVVRATSRDLPVLKVEIGGDLCGWAQWHLAPDGDGTVMRFEQQVELARMPGLAVAAGRPLLRWNHRRMMAGCRAGLAGRVAQLAAG